MSAVLLRHPFLIGWYFFYSCVCLTAYQPDCMSVFLPLFSLANDTQHFTIFCRHENVFDRFLQVFHQSCQCVGNFSKIWNLAENIVIFVAKTSLIFFPKNLQDYECSKCKITPTQKKNYTLIYNSHIPYDTKYLSCLVHWSRLSVSAVTSAIPYRP